jgi:hypothetical protein
MISERYQTVFDIYCIPIYASVVVFWLERKILTAAALKEEKLNDLKNICVL